METEKLPEDNILVDVSWLPRLDQEEKTTAPIPNERAVRHLAKTLKEHRLVDIVAAIEQNALAVLASGKELTFGELAQASDDSQYVEELKTLASPLKTMSLLDGYEALRARVILGRMSLLSADPKRIAPLQEAFRTKEVKGEEEIFDGDSVD